MTVDPAKLRADTVDVVQEFTKALTPGADGVESGFATSEFWLALVVLVGDVVLPLAHIAPLTGQEQGIVAGLAVAGYSLARGIRKNGATAPVAHTFTQTKALNVDASALNGSAPEPAPAPATPSVAEMTAPPSPPA